MCYNYPIFHIIAFKESYIRGGTDKSLARPGKKQATATKLGFYSTHSPRSSIHFLARCCDFFKPLKKIQNIVRPTRSPRQQWPLRWTKNVEISIVSQSREQVVVRLSHIRRLGWVIKTLEARVGQFLLGCKCPVSRCIVYKNKTSLVKFLRCFLFKISFNCTSKD